MPTYEYECEQCGVRFERFQKITDSALQTCPQCGSATRRLPGTGMAVIVKGSGARPGEYATRASHCGRRAPCCGRDAPCDRPPCDD